MAFQRFPLFRGQTGERARDRGGLQAKVPMKTLAGYTRYAFTLKNSRADSIYRALTPALLQNLVRAGVNGSHLPATLHRKLAHTFLVRNGGAWSSFYFDNFYSAFAANEQKDLLDDE